MFKIDNTNLQCLKKTGRKNSAINTDPEFEENTRLYFDTLEEAVRTGKKMSASMLWGSLFGGPSWEDVEKAEKSRKQKNRVHHYH